MISSMDLFFSLDCAAGVGPEVDAPRFGLPAVALAGSAFLAAEGFSVDVEGAGRKLDGIDEDAAPVKDGPLAADVPGAGAVGFSVGLPKFANILVVEDAEVTTGVGTAAAVDELVVWPPRSNKLLVFVAELLGSLGLDVDEGKLNDGFDSFGPLFDGDLGNKDGALVCSDAVVAADCPPIFWKSGFGVSI